MTDYSCLVAKRIYKTASKSMQQHFFIDSSISSLPLPTDTNDQTFRRARICEHLQPFIIQCGLRGVAFLQLLSCPTVKKSLHSLNTTVTAGKSIKSTSSVYVFFKVQPVSRNRNPQTLNNIILYIRLKKIFKGLRKTLMYNMHNNVAESIKQALKTNAFLETLEIN